MTEKTLDTAFGAVVGTPLYWFCCRWWSALAESQVDRRGLEYNYFSGRYERTVRTIGSHESGVTILVLSPDGRRLYLASNDTTIKVWDLETGNKVLALRGHTGPIYSLVLSSDDQRLFSGSSIGMIKVRDLVGEK